MRILLVEDDPTLSRFLQNELEAAGIVAGWVIRHIAEATMLVRFIDYQMQDN